MSQLNNEPKTIKVKKGMKGFVIYIVIMIIVCALATAGLIYYTNHIKNKEEEKSTPPPQIEENKNKKNEDNLKITGISEKYSQNPLTITAEKYDTGFKEKIVQYDQINGLKDKSIQEKINNQIKDKTIELYNKIKSNEHYGVNAHILSNFGDIISVNISSTFGFGDEYKTLNESLNLKLKDGTSLAFKEMFTADAPINTIITDSAYKDLLWKRGNELRLTDDELMGEIDSGKIDMSDFDDEALRIISLFNQDKGRKFYFTPQKISLIIEGVGYDISINMPDFMDSIAIYKRFKSNENLYEETKSNADDRFVFTDFYWQSNSWYDRYGEVNDSLFEMVRLLGDDSSPVVKSLESMLINQFKKELELIRNSVDISKGTILDIFGSISYDEKNPVVYFNISYTINTMSKEYYTKNYISLITAYEQRAKSSMLSPLVYEFENKNVDMKDKNIWIEYDTKGNILKQNRY
ncbi:MAG: hypothetical protein PHP54_03840 [Clostridia bacterium]|nr:hypothetical protein [Clostridia bacterium]